MLHLIRRLLRLSLDRRQSLLAPSRPEEPIRDRRSVRLVLLQLAPHAQQTIAQIAHRRVKQRECLLRERVVVSLADVAHGVDGDDQARDARADGREMRRRSLEEGDAGDDARGERAGFGEDGEGEAGGLHGGGRGMLAVEMKTRHVHRRLICEETQR